MLKPIFNQWNCDSKRVFLRADLNVPIAQGNILDDARLQATKQTLDALLQKNAIIILATHMGEPHNHEASLSTKQLVPWFEKQGYNITYVPDLEKAHELSKHARPRTILLLENLRFFKGEKAADPAFARILAQLADYYVDDAFGALHRNDASMSLLPLCFDATQRSIGLLVEKELSILDSIVHAQKHPFTLILGGSKVSTKIPIIERLMPVFDTLILCPALVFTFMKAQNIPVGKSLVENELLQTCQALLEKLRTHKKEIIMPTDFQVAQNSYDGALSFTDTIKQDQVGISIGPKTIKTIESRVRTSKMVFFNGAIGFLERPETLQGLKAIFTAMSTKGITSIVAGGDSCAALNKLHVAGISATLAGGGSALAYLAGDRLPGLVPFLEDRTKTN